MSERDQAKAPLNASEQEFFSLAEAMPQIVWITRPDGWNIYFNRRWFEYTGMTPEESAGHGWNTPFHPDDQKRAWDAWQAATQHGATYSLECRLRRADGSYHWWLIRGEPVRDAAGNVLKWIGTCTDIEQIKQAQDALRESRAKLEAALAAMTDAVWITDTQGRFIEFNEAFARIHRFKSKEDCAKTLAEYPAFLDVFRPDGSLLPLEEWAVSRALRGETAANQEYTLRRRDTGETWIGSYGLAPIRDEDGRIVGSVMTGRDITDRKRAEEELTRMSERLALATRAARLGIWDWDVVNDQLVWDDGMYGLYGLDKGEFGGAYEAWVRGVHPDDRARARQDTDRALRGEGTYESEFRVVWPDGTVRDLAAQGTVVRDAAGRPLRMIGVNHDVTERKQAEEALRASLEEKGALLREVHHRVNNNLQVIASLLRLETSRTEGPDARRILGEMQGRVMSMALLHETLYKTGNFSDISLADYLKGLADQLLRAHRGTGGRATLSLDLTEVRVGIEQAIPCGLLVHELLSNCLKHAFVGRDSGEITLRLRKGPAGRVELAVIDNGVGLPADFEERRTRSLGLQLVSDLARQLGSDISIGAGPGASFGLTFAHTPAPRTGEMFKPRA